MYRQTFLPDEQGNGVKNSRNTQRSQKQDRTVPMQSEQLAGDLGNSAEPAGQLTN